MNIFLTVDTEHSIGGAFADPALRPVGNEKRIWGRLRGKEYGIPLMMDIAEAHGLQLVFFVEVLNRIHFGKEETREVVEAILKRGHDVQLHLHPNYQNFRLEEPGRLKFSDFMLHYPLERQIELLEEGADVLKEYGVPRPVAFRAGCYGANRDTLSALSRCGFRIDSSYSRSFLGRECGLPDRGINDVAEWDGLYEFPITHFAESLPGRKGRVRPCDLNAAGGGELLALLKASPGERPSSLTVILHSFSFLKPYDVQYRRARPRREVIRRFEVLCRFLANHPDWEVKTFGDLSEDELQALAAHGNHVTPSVPAWATAFRLAEQLRDRF